MAALRDHSSAINGTAGLGGSTSARSAFGSVQQVRAIDIPCPAVGCSAQANQDCTTGRWSRGRRPVPLMCPERIELALAMRDRGELEITVTEPVTRCRLCITVNNRVKRCDNCRCSKHGCPAVRASGSKYCVNHVGLSRPGRAPKLDGPKLARLQEMRAEGGRTQEQIAAELGCSVATVYKALKTL